MKQVLFIIAILVSVSCAAQVPDTIYTTVSPVKNGKYRVTLIKKYNGKEVHTIEVYDLERTLKEIDLIKEQIAQLQDEAEMNIQTIQHTQREIERIRQIRRELTRRLNILNIRANQLK